MGRHVRGYSYYRLGGSVVRTFIGEDMPSSGAQDHAHKFTTIKLECKGPNNTVLAVCECGESRWVPAPRPIEEGQGKERPLLVE